MKCLKKNNANNVRKDKVGIHLSSLSLVNRTWIYFYCHIALTGMCEKGIEGSAHKKEKFLILLLFISLVKH